MGDIDRLDAFLRVKSPEAAERATSGILECVERLRRFPSSGRPVPGLGPEYRELPLAFGAGGDLIFYHERGPNVHILAVRHMREAGY